MIDRSFTIMANTPLTPQVYRLDLAGPVTEQPRPGQFYDLSLPGLFLRRPISICDAAADRLTLVYKTVGQGTGDLSRMAPGQALDLLGPLGNGFDLAPAGDRPLLIAGGVGAPPLFYLARQLLAAGITPQLILGFAGKEDIFLAGEFRSLGIEPHICTEDGSLGTKGVVTALAGEVGASYLYVCGPEPMLKAVYQAWPVPGQFSFEERMGCGFGACVGCSRPTKNGYKRICVDGPVLDREEILW